MCGIVGYRGNGNASEILLQGLRNLEYRGYDSVGMAILEGKELKVRKDAGRVEDVNSRMHFAEMGGARGIAHTRWATHGAITKENSHPHTSMDGSIAVVHNGIIENYSELKRELEEEGFVFSSQTDTEVIPMLMEKFSRSMKFEDAAKESLKRLEGTFAIAAMSRKSDRIIAAKKASPLVIGVGAGEYFIGSDVTAFIAHTNSAVFLDDNEFAEIGAELKICNFVTGERIMKEPAAVKWNAEQAKKGGFEHYMLKEIFEQPRAVRESLMGRAKEGKILPEPNDRHLKGVRRIMIVACGTSWHAALIGKFMIESLARLPVEVDYASEFRYREPVIGKGELCIAISQSGETADTLAAVKEAKARGARVLSICNVMGSTIARESDSVIYTQAGPEIGVASTKAFTSQLAILHMLALRIARARGAITQAELSERVSQLEKIPKQMEIVLKNNSCIKRCAERYYSKQNALYLGRGTNYPIALEGALKLKEVSYIHAEGYPAAEMKHGPIALIDNQMPVVVIAVKDKSYKKIVSNIEEIKSRAGIVTKGDKEVKARADYSIAIPQTTELLYPFLTVVPLQLLAYYIAKYRECDIDKPKNLAKSVTVE